MIEPLLYVGTVIVIAFTLPLAVFILMKMAAAGWYRGKRESEKEKGKKDA